MGNCLNLSSSPTKISKIIEKKPMPIETKFELPSPLPTWPRGEGFASGTIDLGGLEVCQVSSFTKVWTTYEGGPDNLGATFFEPSQIPEGFFMLGSYGQPNNTPLFGWVLAGKDLTTDPSNGALKQPIDYKLVWSSKTSKIKQDGICFLWLPTPPDGYTSIGHVVTNSPEKPSLDKIRCVRSDFTDVCEADSWIWGRKNEINLHNLRPKNRGILALGMSTGAFLAQNGRVASKSIACLKNVKHNLSSMPNLSQIQALVKSYSPWIYFHPKEQYLPSSVTWFFKNGALLCTKGKESNPVSIDSTGSNLPQGGSDDGAYWLDLPVDKSAKELAKGGSLHDAEVYLHIKPMLGGTFTDIVIWVFHPFNGPGRAKVNCINLSLGKIGEHIGDWEHVTLRVSNFDGGLKRVYLAQHGKGIWVNVSELEFQKSNKPVIYSSLHGHALYPKPGLVLQGSSQIGIRNDTAKSKIVMDSGVRFLEVSAEYLGLKIVEPPWLNYARRWGPKVEYRIADEVEKFGKFLPGKVKAMVESFIKSLPSEVFGEEGPEGPKMKVNWSGDEKI